MARVLFAFTVNCRNVSKTWRDDYGMYEHGDMNIPCRKAVNVQELRCKQMWLRRGRSFCRYGHWCRHSTGGDMLCRPLQLTWWQYADHISRSKVFGRHDHSLLLRLRVSPTQVGLHFHTRYTGSKPWQRGRRELLTICLLSHCG